AAVEELPGVLDPRRVAPYQARDHVIGEVARHRQLAAVERRVADPAQPVVGLDLERDEVPPGTGDDDAGGDDPGHWGVLRRSRGSPTSGPRCWARRGRRARA